MNNRQGETANKADSKVSVEEKSPRQGAKVAFDGWNGCQKCFCVTFGKVTKLCAVSDADLRNDWGDAIEKND